MGAGSQKYDAECRAPCSVRAIGGEGQREGGYLPRAALRPPFVHPGGVTRTLHMKGWGTRPAHVEQGASREHPPPLAALLRAIVCVETVARQGQYTPSIHLPPAPPGLPKGVERPRSRTHPTRGEWGRDGGVKVVTTGQEGRELLADIVFAPPPRRPSSFSWKAVGGAKQRAWMRGVFALHALSTWSTSHQGGEKGGDSVRESSARWERKGRT